MNPALDRCRHQIEARLGWGSAATWSTADFDALSERIEAETGVLLSTTTLKRVWGRVAYASSPSPTTLDALARYLGHESWAAYAASTAPPPTPAPELTSASAPAPARPTRPRWLVPALALAFLITAGVVLLAFTQTPDAPDVDPADYAFDYRPLAEGVPNTVVFTYDASAAPTDSVFIQQNWDPRRRTAVSTSATTHTSTYYLPGFYLAKLLVGDRVVRERELMIPSRGWTVAVNRAPVPVYLPEERVRRDGRLSVTAADLTAQGISLTPDPPYVSLSSVGAFGGVFSDNFVFRTRLRHDLATGAAACQRMWVLLLLKNGVITVPLSRRGCVGELRVLAGGRMLDGSENDFSGLGFGEGQGVELNVTGRRGEIAIQVNDQPAITVAHEQDAREIVGVRYELLGLGSIEELRLANDSLSYREDFFDESR